MAAHARLDSGFRCDVDVNGVVGMLDMNEILHAVRGNSGGPADPRDVNGDGSISVEDVATIRGRRSKAHLKRMGASAFLALGAFVLPLGAFGDTTRSGVELGAAPYREVPQDTLGWRFPGTVTEAAAPTRDMVVQLFNNVYLPGNSVALSWSGSVASCDPGTTNVAHQQATIDRVNYYRTLVQLPAVGLQSGLETTQSQAAALMMSANDMLNHNPPPTWTCYSANGAAGASHSNLALGIDGVDAIDGYMDDGGGNNSATGHRRWILYPPQSSMATGNVPSSVPSNPPANALYVLLPFGTRPATPNGVAWPPSGFVPYQNLPSFSNRWSFSYPGADFSTAAVTMTGPNGPTPIPVTYESIQTGFGDNTLVFLPTDFAYANPGSSDATYTVVVNGMKGSGVPASVTYTVTVISPNQIAASERSALLDLYAATNGAGWSQSDGWGGAAGSECTWYGVTCDFGGSTVTGLQLSGNNLTGSLPSRLHNLSNLATLYVDSNSLTGTIPALTGLTKLQYFVASSNELTGPIPALTGLTNLQQIEVGFNQLSGAIPALAGLTNLQQIDVRFNQLSGPIPALTGLTNLQQIDVSFNQVSGSIPALTGLTNLQQFVADSNQLSGSIPALTGLTNLKYFRATGNQLSGAIPALTGLTKLQYFTASSNQLSGSIPALTGLTNLQLFYVDDNQLTGSIPALTGLTKLQGLLVEFNQLTGNVPISPSPSALTPGGSALCPNHLNHTVDPAWDAATGETPWYANCAGVGPPSPPLLTSAVSRRVHGGAGTFDMPLSLVTTNPTTEPRQGPAQTIVFTFDKTVTAGAAGVTEGTATIGAVTFNGNEMVVPLSGVSNQQYVTVAVSNVNSPDGGAGGAGSVRVGFLLGDVSRNRVVTLSDLAQVNAQIAQPVSAANYLMDVNASGTLSVADKGITNSQVTKALPAP